MSKKHDYGGIGMKLVGKLKDDVAKAENAEEAKKLIENAGMQLTDEEMENVAGGYMPGGFEAKRPIYDNAGNVVGYTGGVFK